MAKIDRTNKDGSRIKECYVANTFPKINLPIIAQFAGTEHRHFNLFYQGKSTITEIT